MPKITLSDIHAIAIEITTVSALVDMRAHDLAVRGQEEQSPSVNER